LSECFAKLERTSTDVQRKTLEMQICETVIGICDTKAVKNAGVENARMGNVAQIMQGRKMREKQTTCVVNVVKICVWGYNCMQKNTYNCSVKNTQFLDWQKMSDIQLFK